MEFISEYLRNILVAALICSILLPWADRNKSTGHILKLLCGVFLAITMIQPLTKFKNLQWVSVLAPSDVAKTVEAGTAYGKEEMGKIISDQSCAYILDKAESLGLDIQVEVLLSSDFPPVPESVIISGSGSPYNKQVLTKMISDDLAIPEDKQIWK